MNITATHNKAIKQYYLDLEQYHSQQVTHELALKTAFQNLLPVFAQSVQWTLIPEQTLANGRRPDGTLRDTFGLPRGYWEAKDTKDDLAVEIRKKIAAGYPTNNIIFEDTQRGILYQNGKPVFEADLRNPKDLIDLLQQFFTYTEPDIATFEAAVDEFRERIPDLAQGLLTRIREEYRHNISFSTAFSNFQEVCRSSIDPAISREAVEEMLVQHLLTERLFRTIFNDPDFTQRNIIATEIERVIKALTSRAFNRTEFLKSLDRFYVAIEGAARGLDEWAEKQRFLNTVYERFFQGFSVKQADTHGIVYTPQEIVDFMCTSVEEVLQREFHAVLSTPGVQILDPATGTGNFIVNLIRRISGGALTEKYSNDLYCNEIMLLPYYIASLNIEHAYYERTGQYQAFEGICFADTLNLEGQQMELFNEQNTRRMRREKDAAIMVLIGNPPYNMGQKNESDNNKNRRYEEVDRRIHETYARGSKATLTNKLYDAYVKFFRWATDRLQGRNGIVCFVSNNSFVDQIAFDSMRKHLMQDFTYIYHLDLHGNVRRNPKLSGTTHNVFGIQVGVGITIAVRTSRYPQRTIYYHRVPEYWRKEEKLAFLSKKQSISAVEWLELSPDERHTWLTEGIHPEFVSFLPIGTKEIKGASSGHNESLFKMYSLGVVTSRDSHAYSFDTAQLGKQVRTFIDIYNSAVDTLKRKGTEIEAMSLVDATDRRIKWTRQVKASLTRLEYSQYAEEHIRNCLYRPFTRKKLYFDAFWNEERYRQPLIFPTSASETENIAIVVSDHGYRAEFSTLATNITPELHTLAARDAFQCFPYYTYAEDGSNRRENITDYALSQFQTQYSGSVSKRDIFHYVYAMLHHPQYRERYAENLKHDLPHIPLLKRQRAFEACVRIGQQLMELHLHYEQAQPYPLQWVENKDVPINWRVEKMRLLPDKSAVVINEWLTLGNIPTASFQYHLGNRSALEWVLDQYQVNTDKRSGIVSDPNRDDQPQYIVRLVQRIVTVSVATVRLVEELATRVTQKDWLEETRED